MSSTFREARFCVNCCIISLHMVAQGDHTFNRAAWEDEVLKVSAVFFGRELA